MSLWNKIVFAMKFAFGGFESVTDYVLKLINDCIGNGNVAERVKQVREFVRTAISYLKKYEKYCPAIWAEDYLKLIAALQTLVDALEDGKISAEEAAAAVSAVQYAISKWME